MAYGFLENHKDPTKRFIRLNVGSADVVAVIEKAAKEGSIVILDEFNIAPPKKLLNRIMSGIKSPHTGFLLIATQNPVLTHPGRELLSLDVLNRFHKITLLDYRKEELLDIAQQVKLDNPERFVDDYLEAKAANPKKITMHAFYHAIKTMKSSVKPYFSDLFAQSVQPQQKNLSSSSDTVSSLSTPVTTN